MKKLIIGVLAFASFFTLVSCKKKPTDKKTTAKPTSSTKKITSNNPNYESNYAPILSDSLPRIDINVDDSSIESGHEMDFVTVPNRENKWDYTTCKVTVSDGEEISIDNKTAGVKVRGNWTTNYDKKPLRIKFDKKQSMLDLHNGEAYKNWLLLAEYKDWSMLRNASAFYLAHLMDGNYVSDFRLVNVYINNQYWGVYLLCEQQEVKAGRIDISEPKQLEDNTYYTGNDIGYFLEYDGYYTEEDPLNQFEVNYKDVCDYLFSYDSVPYSSNNFQKGFTIKSDIYSDTQTKFIKNYMQNVFKICYEAIYNNKYYEFNSDYTEIVLSNTLTNQYDTIARIMDVDSLVNSYILADVACDVDVAWSSFFMDVDFGENGDKLLRFEAPWDYDSGFGNTRGCVNGEGIYAANIFTNAMDKQDANPWYLLFMHADWFKKLVKDKWNSLIGNKVFEKVLSYINTVSTKYETDFINNYDKWGNCGHPESTGWEQNETSRACKTQKESATYLYNWLDNRIKKLTDIYNTFE